MAAGKEKAPVTERDENPPPPSIGPDSKPGYTPAKEDSVHTAKMQWWREARFGMFIHWGVYSVYEGYYKGRKGWKYAEHIMNKRHIPVKEYEKTAATFNPVDFDAKKWVALAEEAGMRYMVITAKHHDGFCLFDSDHTKYDMVDWTTFKRDPIRELADACKGTRVRFCLYYSHMDWHYTDKRQGYDAYRMNQVTELVEKYDPGVLWFDDFGNPGTKELLKMLQEKYPKLILNERVTERGKGDGDFKCAEQAMNKKLAQEDWEGCLTMNGSWGYHKGDTNWKSTTSLVRRLISVVSYGGNFLLNVGPTGKGVIPAASAERLKGIGDWMKINGESIYGAGYADIEQEGPCKFTAKPGKLYAFLFKTPKKNLLTIQPNDKEKVLKAKKAYMLADPGKNPLKVAPTETGGLQVTINPKFGSRVASVVVIELDEDK